MVRILTILLYSFIFCVSCNHEQKSESSSLSKETQTVEEPEIVLPDTSKNEKDTPTVFQSKEQLSDTSFVNIKAFIPDADLDFVYTDTANFFKTAVYPCEECLLRKEVALALVEINDFLKTKSLKLQLLDCYRPFSVQQFMWKILPDSRYVANPNKGGSIHNKGGAVDLRLLYINGDTVPMGTEFDHFGKEAAHSYKNLPDVILQNRELLKNTMEQFGFISLQTEWWHYTYKNAKNYPVASISLSCK